MEKKILIAGAGGFIGGHLIKKLINENYDITAVDIKPLNLWFQKFNEVKNYSLDLKEYKNCDTIVEGQHYIINMACNMGGMGFIENNKAECMLSVLINTNLLMACKKYQIKKYLFSSSACVYNTKLQQKIFIEGLKEEDAYPASPEDGYGWEKLFSERMCRHFYEDYGLETRVVRYHNVYGPLGTYGGGREKSPAALCRKIALAKKNNKNKIEIWGDGNQTRSYLYIDDCITGTLKLFESNFRQPLNIGSDEQVSINELVSKIERIAQIQHLNREYKPEMPLGVRGRNSNNELMKKILNWNYEINLEKGLKETYKWIEKEINNPSNDSLKFTQS